MTCVCIDAVEICISSDCRNKTVSPGRDPAEPLTPAQYYLHSINGIASQEWQDGYNTAARHYAGLKKLHE